MLKTISLQLWIFSFLNHENFVQCSIEKIGDFKPDFEISNDGFDKVFQQMDEMFEKDFETFDNDPFFKSPLESFDNDDENDFEKIVGNVAASRNKSWSPNFELDQSPEIGIVSIVIPKLNLTSSIPFDKEKQADDDSSTFGNVLSSFHKFIDGLSGTWNPFIVPVSNAVRSIGNLHININDNGNVRRIPENALVYTNPSSNSYYSYNITWTSDGSKNTDSLSFNLLKKSDNEIVLQDMRLRIVNGNKTREYLMKDGLAKILHSNENSSVVNLDKNVDVNFPNNDFFDFVVARRVKENVEFNWIAIFIAIFGLITAGLIMMLSCLIYKKDNAKEAAMINNHDASSKESMA